MKYTKKLFYKIKRIPAMLGIGALTALPAACDKEKTMEIEKDPEIITLHDTVYVPRSDTVYVPKSDTITTIWFDTITQGCFGKFSVFRDTYLGVTALTMLLINLKCHGIIFAMFSPLSQTFCFDLIFIPIAMPLLANLLP